MKLIPGNKAQESQNEMSEKEKTVHKNSDAHNRKRYGAANATLLCWFMSMSSEIITTAQHTHPPLQW